MPRYDSIGDIWWLIYKPVNTDCAQVWVKFDQLTSLCLHRTCPLPHCKATPHHYHVARSLGSTCSCRGLPRSVLPLWDVDFRTLWLFWLSSRTCIPRSPVGQHALDMMIMVAATYLFSVRSEAFGVIVFWRFAAQTRCFIVLISDKMRFSYLQTTQYVFLYTGKMCAILRLHDSLFSFQSLQSFLSQLFSLTRKAKSLPITRYDW